MDESCVPWNNYIIVFSLLMFNRGFGTSLLCFGPKYAHCRQSFLTSIRFCPSGRFPGCTAKPFAPRVSPFLTLRQLHKFAAILFCFQIDAVSAGHRRLRLLPFAPSGCIMSLCAPQNQTNNKRRGSEIRRR